MGIATSSQGNPKQPEFIADRPIQRFVSKEEFRHELLALTKTLQKKNSHLTKFITDFTNNLQNLQRGLESVQSHILTLQQKLQTDPMVEIQIEIPFELI